MTQDRGARALAERLHETAVRNHNLGEGPLRAICDRPESHEPRADAILANGAVFLPDAAEPDRLRRIEAAARRVNDAMQTVWATSQNFAEEPRSGDARTFWLMARDEADAAHRALRAALEPEGSAQG